MLECQVLILVIFSAAVNVCSPSSPNMYRTLKKNGFHRDLFTKLLIPSSLIEPGCECLIEEEFPPGMYVDPYELKNLREKGGPQFISAAVDIEKPKELSTSFSFIIYPKQLLKEGSEFVTNVTIPVHVRYHQPLSEESTAHVVIQNPHIYLLCHQNDLKTIKKTEKQFPCSGSHENCTWTEISYKTDASSIYFDIPVGSLYQQTPVVSVTLAVTLIGCLFLSSKILQK
ncbi:phosphatidylinositol-glycan biosynthesis class X protein-like [Saccostrea echinata]|uniref:phosphatidylinositol-glycan biosynthesis class X protein-like n=1 Tax=Saccostrea echinata TaxID=191078 RepID=UPI002A80DB93|nr:phosphatidylinositol-glycan biosynthesis class X protein-like [Saccostrea echinata]